MVDDDVPGRVIGGGPADGEPRRVKVALLGCGTVGSEVARLLSEQGAELAARAGASMELVGCAVRRPRWSVPVPPSLVTTDAWSLVDSEADVVVELIGGLEPARTLLLRALRNGKSVVTANKALLAEHGAELFGAADKAGADLHFEAAAAGAVPIVRSLRESLAGDCVHRVMGIVNGTTNYVLSRMDEAGLGYGEALQEATELGYAEADPTADVDGFDAAAKAALLASLAFHSRVGLSDVHREGITGVSAADLAAARSLGRCVKLLAVCERVVDGDSESVSARVHPAMISRDHPLARVDGAFNAVFVETAAAGPLMLYGQGAGGTPTASAVLGDLVSAARNRITEHPGPQASPQSQLPVRSIGWLRTRYHVGLDVVDESGVLAEVSSVFNEHGVSISTVQQQVEDEGRAQLVLQTHSAVESTLGTIVDKIAACPVVRRVSSVIRIEE